MQGFAFGLGFGRHISGSGAASDAYAIGGASPELVAAFLTAADGTTAGEYFRTGGSVDDFSMFTFSRSDNATMFDSTGTLYGHRITLCPIAKTSATLLGLKVLRL